MKHCAGLCDCCLLCLFLQHAAVIEIFPYYMKKQTYAYLAGTMGHFYFPMYSWTSG